LVFVLFEMRRPKLLNPLLIIFSILLMTFLYNEYLIYWQVLLDCKWPKISISSHDSSTSVHHLNLMIISDTHLLGSRQGHWFDKLRREWQQHMAFQTLRKLLKPDFIIIVGDLTDEGKWCSDAEWNYYERRALELFNTETSTADKNEVKTQLLVVAGNHDVGFHYDMTEKKLNRFNRSFKSKYIRLYLPENKEDLIFVFLNSMALENDGCKFCNEAQKQLNQVNKTLDCLKMLSAPGNSESISSVCKGIKDINKLKSRKYSKPVLFTHFPLYRKSDRDCPNDIDTEKYVTGEYSLFRSKYDCLGIDATKQVKNFYLIIKL
jgi:ethanolamine phosphate phosphodiesterase